MVLADRPVAVESPLVACRPTLGRYLATWLPAQRSRALFRQVEQFLLFIGYPRSGHTLIGSLLNAHREALVGHELNALHYVKRRFSRHQLYWMLYEQDRAFSAIGRQWTTYDYHVPGQWQGRFEPLRIIGDKHGNGATTLLGKRPDVLPRLRRTVGVPVKMLHVVRHPLDNIATMSRKYEISLESAAATYFDLCRTNLALLEDGANDTLTVHLEAMIERPRQELLKILGFLGLPADVGYLNDCASIVFPAPRESRSTVAWTDELLGHITLRCREFPFLERYQTSSLLQAPAAEPIVRRAA